MNRLISHIAKTKLHHLEAHPFPWLQLRPDILSCSSFIYVSARSACVVLCVCAYVCVCCISLAFVLDLISLVVFSTANMVSETQLGLAHGRGGDAHLKFGHFTRAVPEPRRKKLELGHFTRTTSEARGCPGLSPPRLP